MSGTVDPRQLSLPVREEDVAASGIEGLAVLSGGAASAHYSTPELGSATTIHPNIEIPGSGGLSSDHTRFDAYPHKFGSCRRGLLSTSFGPWHAKPQETFEDVNCISNQPARHAFGNGNWDATDATAQSYGASGWSPSANPSSWYPRPEPYPVASPSLYQEPQILYPSAPSFEPTLEPSEVPLPPYLDVTSPDAPLFRGDNYFDVASAYGYPSTVDSVLPAEYPATSYPTPVSMDADSAAPSPSYFGFHVPDDTPILVPSSSPAVDDVDESSDNLDGTDSSEIEEQYYKPPKKCRAAAQLEIANGHFNVGVKFELQAQGLTTCNWNGCAAQISDDAAVAAEHLHVVHGIIVSRSREKFVCGVIGCRSKKPKLYEGLLKHYRTLHLKSSEVKCSLCQTMLCRTDIVARHLDCCQELPQHVQAVLQAVP